jgi:hypothetical protein
VAARQFGDMKRRNRRRVGERLVIVHRERLGDADGVGRDDLFVMIRVEVRGGRARLVDFVVRGIAEPDRERLDRLRGLRRHQREHRG